MSTFVSSVKAILFESPIILLNIRQPMPNLSFTFHMVVRVDAKAGKITVNKMEGCIESGSYRPIRKLRG